MSRLPHQHIAWARAHMWRFPLSLADSAIAAPDLAALGLPHSAPLTPDGGSAQPELERRMGERLGAPGGQVMLAAGASEANACVFAALLSPGDEVLAEVPGYEPHRIVPQLFGATVRGFERPLGARPGTLAPAIESALGPRTRLIVLSDLENPTGAALEAEDLAALDALAARRGLRLLCDETFRDAGSRPPATVAARAPHWVTTASLTKVYGLGSLRIGWVAGDAATREACRSALDSLSAGPAGPSAALALALLPHLDSLRARTHAILAQNHAAFGRFAQRDSRFGGPAPAGTTTWREFAGADEGDRFAAFAGERFGLAIARGSYFGRARGIRITLGSEPAQFAAALEALERAAAEFPWSAAEAHPASLATPREAR